MALADSAELSRSTTDDLFGPGPTHGTTERDDQRRRATLGNCRDPMHRNRRRSRAGRDLDDGNLERPIGASAEDREAIRPGSYAPISQQGPVIIGGDRVGGQPGQRQCPPPCRPAQETVRPPSKEYEAACQVGAPAGHGQLILRAWHIHSPCTTGRRNSRSETLQLAAPISCPYTEAPRRRASATLSLVSRWCVVLSAQVALRHPSNRVRPAGLYAASKIHTLDFQQGSPQAPAFVAQGIEHRSPKAGVAGSNPAGGTP